jgi:hypothetical protein
VVVDGVGKVFPEGFIVALARIVFVPALELRTEERIVFVSASKA